MFGGPFRITFYPGNLEGDERAAQLMKRTEADLTLGPKSPAAPKALPACWPARPTHSISRASRSRPAMPREKSAWNDALARAMAYAAAEEYRPALGRPQDFRAERLQPVVETVINIPADKPRADQALLAEMVDDSSAAGPAARLLRQRSVDRPFGRHRSLHHLRDRPLGSTRPARIAANITLGRALRLKAEKRFYPVTLREGIAHLTEALEALRSEPRLKLAESAAQAIGEAQKLLGTRRKFSISGGGI